MTPVRNINATQHWEKIFTPVILDIMLRSPPSKPIDLRPLETYPRKKNLNKPLKYSTLNFDNSNLSNREATEGICFF